MMRVIFFGTETFGREMLAALLDAPEHFTIVSVVTQPPRPVGRKQILTPSPVHELARAHGLAIHTPESLRTPDIAEALTSLEPDLFIVAQYGNIIPAAILTIPKHGAVNVHASILPQLRGASPVHGAILSGLSETGVSFMVMDEKMDHGPVFSKHVVPITSEDTTPTLMVKLAACAREHLVHDVNEWLAGQRAAVAQLHDDATFTPLLSRASGAIDWTTMDAQHISRMVHAYGEWPGVSFCVDEKTFKIISAYAMPAANTTPAGTISIRAGEINISTVNNQNLVIKQIQPAGKAIMSAAAFCNGYQKLDGLHCVNAAADRA